MASRPHVEHPNLCPNTALHKLLPRMFRTGSEKKLWVMGYCFRLNPATVKQLTRPNPNTQNFRNTQKP